jgi:hypothetical protein
MLTACQVTPSPTWQAVQSAVHWPGQVEPVPAFNPRFEYLGFRSGSTSAYLALGYRTDAPAVADDSPPRVREHWYSADRRLLVLDDGRIQQMHGSSVEWRAMRSHRRPRWDELTALDAAPQAWTRTRDEMPGYRYGVVDLIRTRRVDPRVEALPRSPAGLPVAAGAELVWVRDDIRSTLADGQAWQYTQWFALSGGPPGDWRVVWSRQCLTPDWCIDLQPVVRIAS